MNYKATLHLPQTDFPMRAQLPQREPHFLQQWESQNIYQQIQQRRRGSKKYLFHCGPPFANGDAHIGHLLNFTLKDIVVKYRNMTDHLSPFIPGWDCHGLPVEHRVMKELGGGQKMDPVVIREKSAALAHSFVDIQRKQFKRLGIFADWESPYLTMDPSYEAEVLRVFARFVDQGLVYQGLRPVLWSTGCQTALAEAEVEYQPKTDPAIYVQFRLENSAQKKLGLHQPTSLLIWTTTPWTLPANLGVAVSPTMSYGIYEWEGEAFLCLSNRKPYIPGREEARPLQENIPGQDLVGLTYRHPFLQRTGEVYGADFVTAETGTGLVHVAPGHGADDYFLGKEHGLEPFSPVDDKGCFTEACGVPDFVGQYVFHANESMIEWLRLKKVLVAQEDYRHDYPHCWRSKTPIVFRAVKQWFIQMDALRTQALEAVDQVRWIPPWGRNRIYGTIENRPDWCISRQRSWGIPIPVFYGEGDQPLLCSKTIERFAAIVEKEGTDVWFRQSDEELTSRLGLPQGLRKGRDTLDVWIDSGTSHAAVLRKRLWFPADLYLEGSDQHRGWFNSSLCTSMVANGQPPYQSVLTHGFVIDEHGKKYSKSSGATDLATLVNENGADVLRLWVASQDYRSDIPFSREILQGVSIAYRSIRNTLRILLGNLFDFVPTKNHLPREQWSEIDRYLEVRLQNVIKECLTAYETYEFHRVYHTLNQFCSVDLSALYIDVTKDRLYCDGKNWPSRRAVQSVMFTTVHALCRLLAPLLPFTAEEAWSALGQKESVHLQLLPQPEKREDESHLLNRWAQLLELRGWVNEKLETLRQEKTIGKSLEAQVTLVSPEVGPKDQKLLEELFIVSHVEAQKGEPVHIAVSRAPGTRCARSWKYDPQVGIDPDFPDLSPRDAQVMKEQLHENRPS